jgi:hypothetical protein
MRRITISAKRTVPTVVSYSSSATIAELAEGQLVSLIR